MAEDLGFAVEREQPPASKNKRIRTVGYCDSNRKIITVAPDLVLRAAVASLCHELVHALLHSEPPGAYYPSADR
jgi:Zn-dependent peptidase ImmA (M78 family)